MIQLFIFIFILATFLYHTQDKIKETFINQYQLLPPILLKETNIVHTPPTIITYENDDLSNQIFFYLKKYIPINLVKNNESIYNNMIALENKKIDIMVTSEDTYFNACLSKDIFKNKHNNLRFISSLYYEIFLLITYPESGINEWQDIKGKVIGFTGLNTESFNNGFKLAQIVGLSPGKDFQYINVNSMNRLANLLLEKKVDAIYLTTSNKNPYLINLTKKMSIKFIGTREMNPEILKKYFPCAIEKYINTNTFYTNINTSSFIKSFAVRRILIAHKDVSLEYVYNLTQQLYQNSETLKILINNYLYNRDKLNLVKDALIPIEMAYLDKRMKYHLGAEKYYYEFGYLTQNPDCDRYVGQNMFKCGSPITKIQEVHHLWDQ